MVLVVPTLGLTLKLLGIAVFTQVLILGACFALN